MLPSGGYHLCGHTTSQWWGYLEFPVLLHWCSYKPPMNLVAYQAEHRWTVYLDGCCLSRVTGSLFISPQEEPNTTTSLKDSPCSSVFFFVSPKIITQQLLLSSHGHVTIIRMKSRRAKVFFKDSFLLASTPNKRSFRILLLEQSTFPENTGLGIRRVAAARM